MQFSIPNYSEVKDVNLGNYMVYDVYLNGLLHCKLRYKQFNCLHEQLRKHFGVTSLPYFPPKSLFTLKDAQLEERRSLLQKYLQIICQDNKIVTSHIFNDFFLNAQKESQNVNNDLVNLEIVLADNRIFNMRTVSTYNSSSVKESICRELKLPMKYTPFFSLFMAKKQIEKNSSSNTIKNLNFSLINDYCNVQFRKSSCKYVLVRKMMDFESPCLSLNIANQKEDIFCLKLIKFYWDNQLDDKLLDNEVAMDLLYSQIFFEFEQIENQIKKDHYQYLETLKLRKSKKEYILFARSIKYYGYMHFNDCQCDFPKVNTQCSIIIGNNELILKINLANNKFKEFSFRITRIRYWKLSTVYNVRSNRCYSNCFLNENNFKFQLSFEYLVSKDDLKWILIQSEQAILMSTCLHSIAEEIICKKNNLPLYEEKSNEININLRKNSCNYIINNDKSLNNELAFTKSISIETFFVDFDKKKFANCKNRKAHALVQNSVFDGIGDDDL